MTSRKKADDQQKRFIEAAREAGCSEDEAVFDENLKRIATIKPKPRPGKRSQPVATKFLANAALVSIHFEPNAMGWLVEHSSEDALRLIRDRILNGRLELCKTTEIAVNMAQNAIFRLYVRT